MSLPPEGDDSWASDEAERFLESLKGSSSPQPTSPVNAEEVFEEEAESLLGENYLGHLKLGKMQEYMNSINVPISGIWRTVEVPHREDIVFAREHEEIAIYPPLDFNLGNMGIPATLNNISGIFEAIYSRSDGDLPILRDVWYRYEGFAAGGGGDDLSDFMYIHKTPLNEVQIREYSRALEASNAKRKRLQNPSALEVVLTELFYYSLHQRILFPTPVITRTLTDNNEPVYFSGFNSRGIVLESGISPQAHYYPVR